MRICYTVAVIMLLTTPVVAENLTRKERAEFKKGINEIDTMVKSVKQIKPSCPDKKDAEGIHALIGEMEARIADAKKVLDAREPLKPESLLGPVQKLKTLATNLRKTSERCRATPL